MQIVSAVIVSRGSWAYSSDGALHDDRSDGSPNLSALPSKRGRSVSTNQNDGLLDVVEMQQSRAFDEAPRFHVVSVQRQFQRYLFDGECCGYTLQFWKATEKASHTSVS